MLILISLSYLVDEVKPELS